MERLLNARDILNYCSGDKTPTPSTTSETCDDSEPIETINACESTEKITKKCRPDNFEDIDRLCKEVWPVLAVMGGVDRGLRVGAKCVHKPTGKKGVILGALKSGLTSVKVSLKLKEGFTSNLS